MDIAIRVFNYVWFSTWGRDEHIAAERQLAIDNFHRAGISLQREIERAIRDLDNKPGALILQ